MRIKILMVGENPAEDTADIQLLRERGFLVYSCYHVDNLTAMIEEVKPDAILINPHKPNAELTETYNELLCGLLYINVPVIYTLSEDDVYLVNRKRTTTKHKRNLIADNIVDAIKMALHTSGHAKGTFHLGAAIQLPLFNARA